MQKVYLLLRSNKQTGPYSLEELLQLNLKPFDLVWVDGRSAAWQYPFEIPALEPYVPQTPQAQAFQPIATEAMEEKTLQAPEVNSQPQNPIPQKTETPKRVFVSVPKTYAPAKEQTTFAPVNEQKQYPEQSSFTQHKAYMPPAEETLHSRQEEVKQNSSYSKPSQKSVEEEIVSTNYSRSLNDVEEDYTKWMYNKKTKKKASVNPKDLALAVLILVVIGGGYYVMSKPSVVNSALPTDKVATQTAQPVAEKLQDENEPKEILSPGQRVTNNTAYNSTNSKETKQPKNIKTKNPVAVSKGQTNSSVPSVQNSMPVEKTNPNIHNDNDVASKEPEVKQQPKETTTTEKKKKLGEVLKGIFAKKEKKEEVKTETSKNEAPVTEDPKPATNRQAARRDDTNKADDNSTTSTNEISAASLMEQVDLSSNAPDNWMMGVKNLKITLKNRSNVTIQTASVTVSYFDENNQLLDKKLIYFSNVAPKAKATVSAPDHKFADHVDYKLTTISAKEDRYARN